VSGDGEGQDRPRCFWIIALYLLAAIIGGLILGLAAIGVAWLFGRI
jgi:hypothetical protein